MTFADLCMNLMHVFACTINAHAPSLRRSEWGFEVFFDALKTVSQVIDGQAGNIARAEVRYVQSSMRVDFDTSILDIVFAALLGMQQFN